MTLSVSSASALVGLAVLSLSASPGWSSSDILWGEETEAGTCDSVHHYNAEDYLDANHSSTIEGQIHDENEDEEGDPHEFPQDFSPDDKVFYWSLKTERWSRQQRTVNKLNVHKRSGRIMSYVLYDSQNKQQMSSKVFAWQMMSVSDYNKIASENQNKVPAPKQEVKWTPLIDIGRVDRGHGDLASVELNKFSPWGDVLLVKSINLESKGGRVERQKAQLKAVGTLVQHWTKSHLEGEAPVGYIFNRDVHRQSWLSCQYSQDCAIRIAVELLAQGVHAPGWKFAFFGSKIVAELEKASTKFHRPGPKWVLAYDQSRLFWGSEPQITISWKEVPTDLTGEAPPLLFNAEEEGTGCDDDISFEVGDQLQYWSVTGSRWIDAVVKEKVSSQRYNLEWRDRSVKKSAQCVGCDKKRPEGLCLKKSRKLFSSFSSSFSSSSLLPVVTVA